MTNPIIDPISYKAGIEAAAKWHRTEPQTAPNTNEVPTRYKPGEIVVRDGIVRRFIEAEIEGEKWEILGALAPYVHPDHAAPADAERLALAERIERHRVYLTKPNSMNLEQLDEGDRTLIVSSLRAGGWREDMPPVSVGCEREFIVAVYRASSGKAYTFAASYLNAYPLQYEHECPKWKEGVGCSGEGCDDGCPTTGWFEQTGDDDYSSLYNRLEIREGDVFLGWSEIPKWSWPHPSAPKNTGG